MTREEAIKVIDGRFEIMGYCEDQRLEEALDLAIESLKQPQPHWIPCSERLPEEGKVVLWCNEKGSVFTTAITVRTDHSWAVGKRHRLSRVIAWMPLPKPYREEADE